MYNSKTIISMKKILLSISAVTAMIAMTATFSACSSDDDQQSSTTATLVINASRGDYGGGTRTLNLVNDIPVASWTASDNVFVYKAGWTDPIGTLTPDLEKTVGIKTKLTGDLSPSGLNVGDNIEFIMPRADWDYTGQDGEISSISSKYDYAIATVQVTFFDQDNKVYGSTAYFKTQQSIIKYKLVYDDNGVRKPFKATSLTIVANSGKIVTSRSRDGKTVNTGGLVITANDQTNGTDVFYVALRNDSGSEDTYTLTAKAANGGAIYTSAPSQPHNYAFTDYARHEVLMSINDDTHTERDNYVLKDYGTW